MADELSEDDTDKLDWPPFVPVVPPWMSKDWQAMRAHLLLVAAHATAAAEASTTEDVRKNIGAASMGLIDADFLRRTIERGERDREP